MRRVPTIADIRRAAGRLAGHAVRTPLLSNPELDERAGGRVLLKCETLQRTGSFKFRGAYNAIDALGPAGRTGGVVAVSSGNHGQGVAEAARLHGTRATILMPADAPAIKRQRTERSGGRIVTYDRVRDDREAMAAELIAREGGVLIHPFNDPDVIAGQGTVGLEIASGCEFAGVRPDAVVVPCGGGGLSAGVSLALRGTFPEVEVVLAEPAGFDDTARSLRAGSIQRNAATAGSICDALLSPSPGEIAFAIHVAQGATWGVAVSDEEVLAAVAFCLHELKLVVEPGGAVALAAVLTGRVPAKDRTVAVVLSGGNIAPDVLTRALAMDAKAE